MKEINKRCISRKEYLKKYDSNVGYALYVQDNIRKDDYVRLNTGEIVRVIGIKENKLNKKAIYFGIYEQDWFDSMAVENFSDNIIDLIEVGDIVKDKYNKYEVAFVKEDKIYCNDYNLADSLITLREQDIKAILTREQFENKCYKVGGEDE